MSRFRCYSHVHRLRRTLCNLPLTTQIGGIIGTTTALSVAVLQTSNDVSPVTIVASPENRFESNKTSNNNNESIILEKMKSIMSDTNDRLSKLFSSQNTTKTQSSDNINHKYYKNALKLDSSLHSNWHDFHKQIDLIFTQDHSIKMNDNMKARMERVVRATQEHFVHELEHLERINGSNAEFKGDLWKRPAHRCGIASKHSGGLTKVLTNGKVFEKAGVSVSISSGMLPARAVKQMTANHTGIKEKLKNESLGDSEGNVQYFAASVSSVCHPKNPHAPTGHFNYRYFELGDVNHETNEFETKIWWFGGGGDLSPSILYDDDCAHFHSVLKDCCDESDKTFYGKFKKWCDDYFVIKHRSNERRGIGGIFFDDLDGSDDGLNKEELFGFVKECASKWSEAYIPLVARHAFQEFNESEYEWQQIRRGRYAEFNLVYDRGTKFGLMKPGARIESILLSMPLTARWEYCREPIHDFEKEIQNIYQNPRDWL